MPPPPGHASRQELNLSRAHAAGARKRGTISQKNVRPRGGIRARRGGMGPDPSQSSSVDCSHSARGYLEAAAANLWAVREWPFCTNLVAHALACSGELQFAVPASVGWGSVSPLSGKGVRSKVRVLRGGSFNNDTRNLRAANRNRNEPDNRNNNIGFRCVRDVERGRANASAAGAAVVTAVAGVRALLPDRAPGERRAAFGAEQQKGPGSVVAKSETRPGPVSR